VNYRHSPAPKNEGNAVQGRIWILRKLVNSELRAKGMGFSNSGMKLLGFRNLLPIEAGSTARRKKTTLNPAFNASSYVLLTPGHA
jgi:hypothetical protein